MATRAAMVRVTSWPLAAQTVKTMSRMSMSATCVILCKLELAKIQKTAQASEMSETPKHFEKAKRVSYSLPPSLTERLRLEAEKSDRPVSTEVKRRLEWSFKKEAK